MATLTTIATGLVLALLATAAHGRTPAWEAEWPRTDFTRAAADLSEILSGGPPKDGIPAIDDPVFVPVAAVTDLTDQEPVIALEIGGDARAYPLRVLTWHEIVNDVVGGLPVAVTYCPLCNASIVFGRRVGDQVLDFGTTGKLRHSDLVMYDRQTESWWQQFSGEAIVGELTGARLEMLPSRLDSWSRFKARAPQGRVLVPADPSLRPYGRNPYVGYDGASMPFLYQGPLPEGVSPMTRVIVVDGEAWTLPLLRARGTITKGDLALRWEAGQSSALDTARIADGRDVGNVVVERGEGANAEDVVHHVTFAFVFHAFHPEGVIHGE